MEKATGHQRAGGRSGAWTRLALGDDHRNVCERIGRDQPTRMGEGMSQWDFPFLWLPLVGRYSCSPGYSSVRRAHAGVRGAYAGRAQTYVERTQYAVSIRTISSRVVSLWICRGFRSCRGAGEGVLFPGQRRAQSLQEGLSLLMVQPNTTRAPTQRLEGPMAQPRKEPQEEKCRDGS